MANQSCLLTEACTEAVTGMCRPAQKRKAWAAPNTRSPVAAARGEAAAEAGPSGAAVGPGVPGPRGSKRSLASLQLAGGAAAADKGTGAFAGSFPCV